MLIQTIKYVSLLLISILSVQQVRACQDTPDMQALERLKKHCDRTEKQTLVLKGLRHTADVPISAKEIASLTDLQPEQSYTWQDMLTAYEYLKATGRFSSILFRFQPGIPPHTGILTITLIGAWRLHHITLHGTAGQTTSYENLYKQKPGDIFSVDLHEQSLEQYKQFLHNQGYFSHLIVDELHYRHRTKTIIPHITITKGPRFIVRDVQVKLTNKQEESTTCHSLATNLYNLAYHALSRRTYNKDRIKKTAQQIKTLLRNQQFFGSSVTLEQIVHTQKKEISVILHVEPGKQLFYSFAGNTVFSEQQLHALLLHHEQPLWLLEPNILIDQLLYIYRQHGYQEATALYTKQDDNTYHITIDEGPYNVNVEQQEKTIHKPESEPFLLGRESPLLRDSLPNDASKSSPTQAFRFNKIIPTGITRLPAHYIAYHAQTLVKHPLDADLLQKTRLHLKKLGIFKRISITPAPFLGTSCQKAVSIAVVDEDFLEMRVRVGYFFTSKNFLFKHLSTPKVGLSVILNNPTNHADRFVCKTDINKFEQQASAEYRFPPQPSSSLSKNLFAHLNHHVHPTSINGNTSAYQALHYGITYSLQQEQTLYCRWEINLGCEAMQTKRVRGNLKFNPHLINRTVPLFFIEPSCIIDYRDNTHTTQSGSYTEISIKGSLPLIYSQAYLCCQIEHRLYYPFWKDAVLALRVKGGHFFRQHFESLQPIERFYLGGPNSLRGYEKDTASILGIAPHTSSSSAIDPQPDTIQGGSSFLLANLEMRFPLFKQLKGVIFHDIGTMSQSGFLGLKDQWLLASGVGLRYKTPLGALRFDIGWKLKKRFANERRFAWCVTLGEVF